MGRVVGILILLLPLITACAGMNRAPLTADQRAITRELVARTVVVQDEVIVQVPVNPDREVSAAVIGGVIGGAIGGALGGAIAASVSADRISGRVMETQKMAEKLYPAVEDVDFRSDIGKTVSRYLESYPIKVVQQETTARAIDPFKMARHTKHLNPDQGLLTVTPTFLLSPDFRTLIVSLVSTIWVKDKEFDVYRGEMLYQSAAVGGSPAESVTLWSENDGVLFKKTLREAIEELSQMMLENVDLDAKLKTEPTGTKTYALANSFSVIRDIRQIEGQVVSEKNGRVRLLGTDGRYYSIPAKI